MNKVVARYTDGRLIRGVTFDFQPDRTKFHVNVADAARDAKPVEVLTAELKAVFFVRDLAGNPQHEECKEFNPAKPALGRKLKVVFRDGETLVGVTQGYQPNRPGFFLMPADAESNIERCYVVTGATQSVEFIRAG
jgi:hypothetical protein